LSTFSKFEMQFYENNELKYLNDTYFYGGVDLPLALPIGTNVVGIWVGKHQIAMISTIS